MKWRLEAPTDELADLRRLIFVRRDPSSSAGRIVEPRPRRPDEVPCSTCGSADLFSGYRREVTVTYACADLDPPLNEWKSQNTLRIRGEWREY